MNTVQDWIERHSAKVLTCRYFVDGAVVTKTGHVTICDVRQMETVLVLSVKWDGDFRESDLVLEFSSEWEVVDLRDNSVLMLMPGPDYKKDSLYAPDVICYKLS